MQLKTDLDKVVGLFYNKSCPKSPRVLVTLTAQVSNVEIEAIHKKIQKKFGAAVKVLVLDLSKFGMVVCDDKGNIKALFENNANRTKKHHGKLVVSCILSPIPDNGLVKFIYRKGLKIDKGRYQAMLEDWAGNGVHIDIQESVWL